MLSLYGTRTKINPDFDATAAGAGCPEENNCSTITVQKVKLLQPVEVIASRLVHHHHYHKHYSNKEKVDDDLYEAEKLCVKSIESRIRPPHVQGGPIIFALIYSLIIGGVSVEHNTKEDGQFRTPPEWIDVIMNSESLPTPDEIVSQLW
eukprot:scaffold16939_cov51-Attheya_sp.AAC.1